MTATGKERGVEKESRRTGQKGIVTIFKLFTFSLVFNWITLKDICLLDKVIEKKNTCSKSFAF